MKKQLFLLLLLSPILFIASQQSYIPSALQKDFHIANLVEEDEKIDTIDEDTQRKMLQYRLDSNKSETIYVHLEYQERTIPKEELYPLTLQDIRLIVKSRRKPLSKNELTRFTQFPLTIQEALRPNYVLESYGGGCSEQNYRMTFYYRKKITPVRIAQKVFRLDRALLTQLSLYSMLVYTHFITKQTWNSITGTQNPLALAHNSELQRKNAILDQLVQKGILGTNDITKHTIKEEPFQYSWSEQFRFFISIIPSSFLTGILNGMELDAFFYCSHLYYDNGPKYVVSENIHSHPCTLFSFWSFIAHLLIHFNLTKPILLPLTEAFFEDGNMSGIALIAASLLTVRISLATFNCFQWKKKSINFNQHWCTETAKRLKIDKINFSELSVNQCINEHLNNDNIIIR